ncbi:MAG: hypothetical protein LBQ09_04840 [Acidobacteriaceae bacterium]|jgi:hypothetical protein|nr:hypothetical protein [Acidobacteriaceae bacterium]
MRFAPEHVSTVLADNITDAQTVLLAPSRAIQHGNRLFHIESHIMTAERRLTERAAA